VACSRVRGERLPLRQRGAGGADGGVNVRCGSLGDGGELLAGRGISGFEVSAFRRLSPGTVNKMSEAAAMSIQPGERLFRVLRRGTVFHGDELFSNAHIGLVCIEHELEHKSKSKASDKSVRPTRSLLRQGMAIVRRIASRRVVLKLALDIVQQSAGAKAKEF